MVAVNLDQIMGRGVNARDLQDLRWREGVFVCGERLIVNSELEGYSFGLHS